MPDRIAAYVHPPDKKISEKPDTRPGNYYVSVQDNGRFGLLLGPFHNNHYAALDLVDHVRQKAQEVDPRAVFYAFGTARMPESYTRPGVLNDLFGEELEAAYHAEKDI